MKTINCLECGKSVLVKQSRTKAKFCSQKCRAVSSTRFSPHPKTMAALHSGFRKWQKDNPEQMRQVAINNLPKDCNGSKNGNWKGGRSKIRQMFRKQNSSKINRFRKLILDRDKRCRDCGDTTRLEVHHIVPISAFPEGAFVPMNGVVLCHKCHLQTDSYCGRGQKVEYIESGTDTLIATIPHHWHEYSTCGNYALTESGVLMVFVSIMPNPNSELAVGIHEVVEAKICINERIPFEEITKFDLMFEQEREDGRHDQFAEAGDDPRAVYFRAHQKATDVERCVCDAINLSWKEHEQNVNGLFDG